MNVTENIERIMNAKSDLKMSISNKGVEIPDGTLIDEYSSYVDQISSGGGTVDSGGKYLIQVIDYDGTVLKQDHLNEGDTFTLPESPENDVRLVFQGWSSPVDIVNNTVTVGNSDITIGAMYKTASGATEFDITLTKVTGKAVTFQNLTGMTSIDWGDGTTNNSRSHTYSIEGDYTIKVYGVTAISDSIFNTSSSKINYFTRNIFISDSVTTLGDYCFAYCYSLTSVAIPSSVTTLGDYCFEYCVSLTSIAIPSSVTKLGDYYCFAYCYSLTSVAIPSSVTTLGDYCFYTCYSLTSIAIPSSVTTLRSYCFYSCRALTSVAIPSGVTTLGSNCFASCGSLTSIAIPSSVTTLGDYCFRYCYSLTSVAIPSGVTTLGSYCFASCVSLTSIAIPSSVTTLGDYCFAYCYSLTSIAIPSSVTKLGSYCFRYCYSIILFDFSNHTSIPTLSSTSAFTDINAICKILVPASLYDEWIAATNWATYADYIYPVGELPVPTEEISLTVNEYYVGEIPVVTEEISLTVNEYYDGAGSPQWYCRYPTGSAPESPYPVIKLFKDEDYENNLMSNNSTVAQGYMESASYPGQGEFYLNTDFYDDGPEVQYGYYTDGEFKVLIPGKYEWIGYYPETGIPIRKYILNVT